MVEVHRCPLCGGPNACAAAAAVRVDVPCWCRDVVFTPALLARVPAAERDRACVCAACAARQNPISAAPDLTR